MRFVLYSMVIVLAGCATQWTKSGATPQDLAADTENCKQQAAQAYPAQMVQAPPKQVQGPSTNCDKSGCTKVPPTYESGGMVDGNERMRSVAFDACMRSRGWAMGH